MTSTPVTYSAPSNIAFIKYWGMSSRDEVLPANPSISMTLDSCRTTTTARYVAHLDRHVVRLLAEGGRLERPAAGFEAPAARHLERIRRGLGLDGCFVVTTRNSFPTAAGIASSASGFAALTLAAVAAADRQLDRAELSSLARASGSGSAARSLFGGYVEWPAGEGSGEAHAVEIASPDHWRLLDLVAVVDGGEKTVPSREGHLRAPTSAHFAARLAALPERLAAVRQAIAARSLARLGPLVEEDAVELHLVAMSSRPPIFYWAPGTLRVLAAVRALRAEGVEVYATIDAGPNVHLICEPTAGDAVLGAISALPEVRTVLEDATGRGPDRHDEHLPLDGVVDA